MEVVQEEGETREEEEEVGRRWEKKILKKMGETTCVWQRGREW